MGYNKFKIVSLKSKLGIIVQKQYWLPEQLPVFEEDNLLMNVLKESARIYLGSEKARSEFVVTPILQALSRSNKDKFSIFSGYEFNIDKSIELNGFCDFILSSPTSDFVVEAPTFFIVETKKTDIDDNAIAQCGAELYAAQIFNTQNNRPQPVVYGCVTSAYSWAFLKLENNVISIDPNYANLTFNNPYQVLSTLQWVLNQSLQ